MASIRDVAREAGVAQCTVSRVLNGTAKVAPETQKRIEEAMSRLNYVPNELARGMFKGKSSTIAMLVPNIQHPWFSSLASVIEKILYRQGYKLMLFSTNDKEEREKECFRILKSNIVDGIICGTSTMTAEEYQQVDKPMVMLDYRVGKRFPVIVSDHIMGAELAAQEFINSECKYVIHIAGNHRDENIMSLRSHDVLDARLSDAGIRSRRVEICWNDFDIEGYYELAKYILEEYPDIDGVMAADLPATAFLKASLAIGKKFPEDMAIVAYDGTFVVKTGTVQMTTIRQPYEEIAERAVEYLLRMLRQEMDESQMQSEIILPVKLERGVTTR